MTERRHVVIGPEHVGRGPSVTADRRGAAPPTPPPSSPPGAPDGRRPPPGPPRQPPRPPVGPARSPARRLARIALALVAAVAVVLASLFAFGWWQFSRIERVEVGTLAPAVGGGTTYLIVGSDSRDGITGDDPNAGAFLGEGEPSGQRTDTIMVLRVGPSGTSLLSIPRDLWVVNPVTGEPGRINSVHQSGPGALVQAVNDLGIPVQHYLEIDFVSFAGLVDAVGGIDVAFEHPARDERSGLDVPAAGVASLDGVQALAYVRSRAYEELVDGTWRMDPTADLGRVQRQRAFLSALLGEVASSRNPFTVAGVAGALGPGLRIDQDLSYLDALGLAWDLRGGFDPASVTLPVVGRTTSGGAAVLELQGDEAAAAIDAFNRS